MSHTRHSLEGKKIRCLPNHGGGQRSEQASEQRPESPLEIEDKHRVRSDAYISEIDLYLLHRHRPPQLALMAGHKSARRTLSQRANDTVTILRGQYLEEPTAGQLGSVQTFGQESRECAMRHGFTMCGVEAEYKR
jgi:hypothetical protein